MSVDIFEFWSRIPRGANVHPDDKPVFDRLDPKKHGFQLGCLPANFGGPLRTAALVLLYLSPGFHLQDVRDAKTKDGQDYYFRRWRGDEPLPVNHVWAKSRTACFGSWEELRRKVAVLNIGAYHSKTFNDYSVLAALPSSRVSIEWAQTQLFPEAEAGRRAVICLRSAAFWGLERGRKYTGKLFAPEVNRAGFLVRSRTNSRLIEIVKSALMPSQRTGRPLLISSRAE
jgi:hypothetical protein